LLGLFRERVPVACSFAPRGISAKEIIGQIGEPPTCSGFRAQCCCLIGHPLHQPEIVAAWVRPFNRQSAPDDKKLIDDVDYGVKLLGR
jgi:hypothetical protein